MRPARRLGASSGDARVCERGHQVDQARLRQSERFRHVHLDGGVAAVRREPPAGLGLDRDPIDARGVVADRHAVGAGAGLLDSAAERDRGSRFAPCRGGLTGGLAPGQPIEGCRRAREDQTAGGGRGTRRRVDGDRRGAPAHRCNHERGDHRGNSSHHDSRDHDHQPSDCRVHRGQR